MAGFADAFKPRASPEEISRRRSVTRELARVLQVPSDQTLPFTQDLMEAVTGFNSVRDKWTDLASGRGRAPEQLVQLTKAARRYADTIVQTPGWLRHLVEGAMPGRPYVPLGFAPPPLPHDLLDIAKQVRATERAAEIIASALEKHTPRRLSKAGVGRKRKNRPEEPGFSASEALVWKVLTITQRWGGTAKTNKTKGGTLDSFFDKALKLKLWPPGRAPERFTPSKLYRLHNEWKARQGRTDRN